MTASGAEASGDDLFDADRYFSVIAECSRDDNQRRVVVSIKDTIATVGTRRTSNAHAPLPIIFPQSPRYRKLRHSKNSKLVSYTVRVPNWTMTFLLGASHSG